MNRPEIHGCESRDKLEERLEGAWGCASSLLYFRNNQDIWGEVGGSVRIWDTLRRFLSVSQTPNGNAIVNGRLPGEKPNWLEIFDSVSSQTAKWSDLQETDLFVLRCRLPKFDQKW
jgi:hypothetical protein